MKHTLTKKLTVASAAAALALGAAACEIEEDGDLNGGVDEDPILDDGVDDGVDGDL